MRRPRKVRERRLSAGSNAVMSTFTVNQGARLDGPVMYYTTRSAGGHPRGSVVAGWGEISQRSFENGTGTGPYQEEQGLTGPALGGVGAEKAATFSGAQGSLGGMEYQGIGLAAKTGGAFGIGSLFGQ